MHFLSKRTFVEFNNHQKKKQNKNQNPDSLKTATIQNIHAYIKGEEEVGKGCLLNMFRCENGPCIDKQYRCNGHNDCPFDTSDELDCQIWYMNRKLNNFRLKGARR